MSLGGSLDVSLLNTFANNVTDTFTLILNGGSSTVSGFFSNVTPLTATTGTLVVEGRQFTINYAANLDNGATGNDVVATLASVPEPSTAAVLLGATALLGMRRRRSRVTA